MTTYDNLSTRVTPQMRQADPRQARNDAGGFTFQVDALAALRRFLILGTAGGTFYVSEKDATEKAFENIKSVFVTHPQEALDLIYKVSHEGLAHKQSPTLVAFAYACSVDATKTRALEMLPKICRTGTMLFEWWGYVNNFRGMGRGLKTAVRRWYTERDLASLANQLVKYQSRGKASNKKLVGLTRPRPRSEEERALFGFAVGKDSRLATGTVLDGYHEAHAWGGDISKIVHAIEEYRLTHEMLPSEALAKPEVWRALIPHMGLTALIRNLGRMTGNGTFEDRDVLQFVLGVLSNEHQYRAARVHPMSVLLANTTYAAGHGMRGKGSWNVIGHLVDALDDGFKFAFGNVVPTEKRRLLALDVSGSMGSFIGGTFLSCAQAEAAMALVTVATEGVGTQIMGFSHVFTDLGGLITPKASLKHVTDRIIDRNFGATDCALPMLWAEAAGLNFDSFEIYTDNQTWQGSMHPHQALTRYRQSINPNASLVVVGMTATDFTVGDPSDPRTLNVVGMDASAPAAIADFVAGRV